MATNSSILAWRIPRTKEPGGLQSVGSQRGGHDEQITEHTVLHEGKFVLTKIEQPCGLVNWLIG